MMKIPHWSASGNLLIVIAGCEHSAPVAVQPCAGCALEQKAELQTVENTYHTASEVLRAAVVALEAGRWAELVPFIRPGALLRHRDSQLGWLVGMEQRAPRTQEELRAEQPWLPQEVAAFYAEQERTHVSGSLPALRAQWEVASFRELEQLSPAAFFVRYLSASTPAARIKAALAVSHRPPEDVENAVRAQETGHRRNWEVLGEVAEAPDKAHVVYREREGVGSADDGAVRVTTLDLVDGRWWLRIAPPLLDQPGWSFVWAPEPDGPAVVDG